MKKLLFVWKSSKYKNTAEYYQAIDRLIEILKSAGFDEEANQINSLMHETAWTTGSELLGELGLALKNMKRVYPTEIADEITECLAFAIHHRKILGLSG